MKRTAVLGIVLLVVVSFSAAAQARGGAFMGTPGATPEEVELSGRLQLQSGELPVLVSDGQEYTLRIAPALSAELDVTSGQQASVSGFLVERQSLDLMGSERVVMVRSIEVGGTKYVMPSGHMGATGRHMMQGPMMHGPTGRRDSRGRFDDAPRAPQPAPRTPQTAPRGGRR